MVKWSRESIEIHMQGDMTLTFFKLPTCVIHRRMCGTDREHIKTAIS